MIISIMVMTSATSSLRLPRLNAGVGTSPVNGGGKYTHGSFPPLRAGEVSAGALATMDGGGI